MSLRIYQNIPFSLPQISPTTTPSSLEYPLVSATCLHSGRSSNCLPCVTQVSNLFLSGLLGHHGQTMGDWQASRQVRLNLRFHFRPRRRTGDDTPHHDVYTRSSWDHLRPTWLQAYILSTFGLERGSRRCVSSLIVMDCFIWTFLFLLLR